MKRIFPQTAAFSSLPLVLISLLVKLAAASLTMASLASISHAQTAPLSLEPGKQPRVAAPSASVPSKGTSGCTVAAPMPLGEIVQNANGYFNSVTNMTTDFVQLNANGRRLKGKLYVTRPGKMRFDYDAPATHEIVSDGTTVVIRNRKLNTQEVFSIGQTPLKFLLKDKLDLNRDSKVLRGSRDCETIALTIEDKSTVAGTSLIRLQFSSEPFTLRQWTITDPNGNDTIVQLSNIDTSRRPDPKLFKIDTTRELEVK